MPALLASSMVDGAFSMDIGSHITNQIATPKVRVLWNDKPPRVRHNGLMARQVAPKESVDWFIRDWMDEMNVSQKMMIERTGWPKSSVSDIYNGKKSYTPYLVAAASRALGIEPHELFMRPKEALAIRRLRQAVEQIAST